MNLRLLRGPAGSQIKVDKLRISLSPSKGKCSRSSPLTADDLHLCLDLRIGGAGERLHRQPLESGPEQLRGPDSCLTPSGHGPAWVGPEV